MIQIRGVKSTSKILIMNYLTYIHSIKFAVRAKDVYVYDEAGTEYLDLYGGHAVISVGYSHPHYINRLKSNCIKLPLFQRCRKSLQQKLADEIGEQSCLHEYQLFL